MVKNKNKMGFWMLTALVTGNMIGSGIFLLPANLAKIGSISIYSWIITAIGAFLLAVMFAKMSFIVPKAGGPYAYTRKGFGDFLGFQTAYSYWVTVFVGNAAIALAGVGYASVFWPEFSKPIVAALSSIVILWVFTIINLRGARTAGAVQLVTTIAKIAPLLLIAIIGWWYFHPELIKQGFNVSGHSNFTAISNGAALTLWAFIGVESATVGLDTVDNPKRNVPLATLIGTIIAALIYIASSIVIMGIIPAKILATSVSPFALAASQIFGKWGGDFVALGAIISCVGALNGWVLLQGQVAMAAAEDRLFPKIFAHRNKHDIPGRGLVITSILVSLLLLFTISPSLIKQFNIIILLAVISALIPYLYTGMAAVIILKVYNFRDKDFIYVLVSILGAIYSFWAILGSGERIVFYGSILLLSSIPLFAWLKWSQDKERPLECSLDVAKRSQG